MMARFHRGFGLILLLTGVAIAGVAPAHADEIPKGYSRQELPPLEGEILKPQDWFYRHAKTASGWLWTVSKENPADGPFKTGWTGQVLVGIEKGTKEPRESLVAGVISQKSEGREIVKSCPPSDAGMFYRQCLEVIETQQRPTGPEKFRISYSFFWGKDTLDMVVVTYFGAPEAEWPAVQSIAETMSQFKLMSAGAIERLSRQP